MRARSLFFFIACASLLPLLHAQTTAPIYSIFPQSAIGGGWSWDIFINNQGTAAATDLQLSFYDDNGNPLAVNTDLGTNSVFTFTLGGGATQIIRASSTGSVQTGYAVVRVPSSASIRATMSVRLTSAGLVITQLGVSQQFPIVNYSFPAEVDTSRGINTGIAFAYPTFGSTTLPPQDLIVNLINPDGTLRLTAKVSVAVGEHTALFLNEPRLFPGLDNFRGTVSVSSANRFGLIALRLEQTALGSLAINSGPVLAPFFFSTTPIPEVEPNNTATEAQAVSFGAVISASFGVAGDVDLFRIEGRRGDIISVLTDTQFATSSADTVLTLETADGTVIARNDQNGLLGRNDSFLQLTLPSDGSFYLRVRNFTSGGGANYIYRLHVGGPRSTAPQLTSVAPLSAAPGSTVSLTLRGSNLAGANSINFAPSTDLTISNLQASDNQVTASLMVAAGAALGTRSVSVTTPAGTTNALSFLIGTSTGGSIYDGNWTGTTSQGKALSFTIANGRLTLLSVSGSVSGAGCSASFDQKVETNLQITGSSIALNITAGPGGVSIEATGTFTSAASASGTAKLTLNAIPGVPSCSGSVTVTWTATKSP